MLLIKIINFITLIIRFYCAHKLIKYDLKYYIHHIQ